MYCKFSVRMWQQCWIFYLICMYSRDKWWKLPGKGIKKLITWSSGWKLYFLFLWSQYNQWSSHFYLYVQLKLISFSWPPNLQVKMWSWLVALLLCSNAMRPQRRYGSWLRYWKLMELIWFVISCFQHHQLTLLCCIPKVVSSGRCCKCSPTTKCIPAWEADCWVCFFLVCLGWSCLCRGTVLFWVLCT